MIFVNDLYLNLEHVERILFADDTMLYMGHKNLVYLEWCIMEDLKNISDWFKANYLTLNLSKTVGMLFSPKIPKNTPRLKFDDVEIPFIEKTKFLGIWIDNKLSWHAHINTLILRIKRNQHLLRESRNMLNKHCFKMLYYAQIFSHIKYGIAIWGSMTLPTLLTKLQKTQFDCLKLFLDKNNVWQDAKKLGILNINK